MNKTGIEWCDYTWNPVTGCYGPDGTAERPAYCPYCYARKIAERFKGSKAWPQGFEPMFHPERLNGPLNMKDPQTIFVCSMADLFGGWVPARWIWDTFAAMGAAPWHTYIMLTKNPDRMKRFAPEEGDQPRGVRPNWWWGATVTCQEDVGRIRPLLEMDGNRFISFEPLLGRMILPDLIDWGEPLIKQVIIGAQTNPSVGVTPEMVRPIGGATCPGVVPVIKMFCKESMPAWAKARRELCWSVHK